MREHVPGAMAPGSPPEDRRGVDIGTEESMEYGVARFEWADNWWVSQGECAARFDW